MKLVMYIFFAGVLFWGCDDTESDATKKEVYAGPLRVVHDVDMYYSEEARKKVKLKAPKLVELQDGNRDFPDGYYLEFYEEDGTLSSTLRADRAFYYKSENLWKATGNVVVKSMVKSDELNTEELFWKPNEERIYSEKFVTVTTDEQVMSGTGFKSNQDFTNYEFTGASGEFEMKE